MTIHFILFQRDPRLHFGKTEVISLSSPGESITTSARSETGLMKFNLVGRSVISNLHTVAYYSLDFDYRAFTSQALMFDGDTARSDKGTYTVSYQYILHVFFIRNLCDGVEAEVPYFF